MRPAADAEMDVRFRQAEVGKDHVGHFRVVVLPSVHDDRFCPRLFRERVIQRSDLHEIWTGAADEMHDHGDSYLRWPGGAEGTASRMAGSCVSIASAATVLPIRCNN